MKKLALLISIIFLSNLGFAQTMNINAIDDSLNIDDKLTSEQFQKIINKEFNAVINSSGKTTIGNYASADVKDGHLAFNATRATQKDIFSLNANGGITDGVFSIFNQTKVNSNVGVNFKYNRLLDFSSISYHDGEIKKLRKKIMNSDLEYSLSKTTFQHDSILLQSKLNLINTEIKSITSHLNGGNLPTDEKANYEYQIALKNLQKDSLQFKLQTLQSANDVEERASKKRKKDGGAIISSFEYTGIYFNWFSIGAGLQNNNFNQFNPKFSTLDSQVTRQNFIVWNATVEYNIYKWNQYSRPTFYLLLGAKGSIDDNFSDLSKVEINDTRIYGDSLNQRKTSKTFNAYKGDYTTKLLSTKLYVDFYLFFFKNSVAFHLYPEVIYKEKSNPLYNAGIGLLYSFKDASNKDGKDKLHTELYFKLSDLTNNGKSNLTVLGRNELGLRLSVPVSFINF